MAPPTENEDIRNILKGLRQDVELEKSKEEMRKKYDQYKKMFYNEKHEKECRTKELAILKEELPTIELKELKAKYENLKLSQAKEY